LAGERDTHHQASVSWGLGCCGLIEDKANNPKWSPKKESRERDGALAADALGYL
jgi:hypothetical protein